MSTIKLYTEDQVKQIFENLNIRTGYDYSMERYCESITPIELPTDEKIEEGLFHHSNEYALGFKDAIDYLKNKTFTPLNP